jgi:Na+-transporting NADH:ubiquinone oxidoreductase subunit NqrD
MQESESRRSEMSRKIILITGLIIISTISMGSSEANAFAQSQTVPVKKSLPGNQSCDGALDIVPSKSMSFTRKRRPAKNVSDPKAKQSKS